MTFWKDKVTLQKVEVTSWKDRKVKNINSTTRKNTLCSGRENISPIILAQTEMIWICVRLQRAIASENLKACEGYESTRHAGANNVIFLLENVNRMIGL